MNFAKTNLRSNSKTVVFRGLLHIYSHRLWLQLPGEFSSYHSPRLWPRSPSSHVKGLAEIIVLHCIKNDLPRGKFDWLKHGIRGCFPCGRMAAHSNAPAEQVHNTYLYLQSVEHLYLYTFHLCVAPYLLTPGCVFHLCWEICLLCIFTIIIFIFFAAHLVERSSRESMMEAGGNE